MKKFSWVLVVLMVVMVLSACAIAETVTVAITDGSGRIVVANEKIDVSDMDGDGAVTLCDSLWAAHDFAYEGGAEAGFEVGDGGYGMCINKLWGESNGGSYGYYINHVSALNLADPIQDGDYVKVYAYTDLEMWADTYCNFDKTELECAAGENVELQLTAQTFDADWNSISMPVEGAIITFNGEDTAFVTDTEGKVSVSIADAGEYVISARSDTLVLVAPVCVTYVSEA